MGSSCRRWVVAVLLGALVLSGCSDDDDSADTGEPTVTDTESPPTDAPVDTAPSVDSTTTEAETTTTLASAPARPLAVDLTGVALAPITDEGAGVVKTALESLDTSYVEVEHLLSGTAATYSGPAVGPAEVDTEANPYTTRLLVRMPSDPAAFSGRVIVEPFNTSGGSDISSVWGFLADQIVGQGDAWVGVSVRWASMTSLQEFDPARYATISIATNGLAWDMLSHVGALVRNGGEASPLGPDAEVEWVYMAGYSQNGIDTATYASAFGDLVGMDDGSAIYDGYLPLAHSGSMTPLESGATALPAFEFVPIGDSSAPVIDVEPESDVIGFSVPAYQNPGHAYSRRDDSDAPDDQYRLYEIPGGSHVKSASDCDHDGTTFPTEFFIRTAYELLIQWVEDGTAPPHADRIEMDVIDVVSVPTRDENGNALGGVRSPFLDVPLATYKGGDTGNIICNLAGVETPLPAETIADLYEGVDDYLAEFRENLDATIGAGFLREADEAAIVAYATEQAEAAFAS